MSTFVDLVQSISIIALSAAVIILARIVVRQSRSISDHAELILNVARALKDTR